MLQNDFVRIVKVSNMAANSSLYHEHLQNERDNQTLVHIHCSDHHNNSTRAEVTTKHKAHFDMFTNMPVHE